ncbi:MAG TPA: methyltransferase domain-containing protein [Actinoplanes sp.]|nr:methyltransferase domain-containing protein [Actinoplanes sp.]
MEPAQSTHTPFADLDRMPPPMLALLMAALEAMSRHPEIERVRRVAHELLRPAPGQRLMDAGCGNGDVARRLAAEVVPDGEVLAVDYSAVTIEAARQRHDGSRVEYLTGDVSALDLPGDSLDGIWCERVLQHVADADAVIGEFARVLRPGGRMCLIDTDWESRGFDGMPGDLTAAVLRHTFGMGTAQQHDMGRTLRRRLVRAGLSQIEAVPVTLYFDTPESAAVVLPMVNPNVPAEAGLWPDGVREAWLAEVDRAGRRGEFLAVLTIWVVAGRV